MYFILEIFSSFYKYIGHSCNRFIYSIPVRGSALESGISKITKTSSGSKSFDDSVFCSSFIDLILLEMVFSVVGEKLASALVVLGPDVAMEQVFVV